jgi:1,2-diacylglycerol 3-alpha-glucosyltransferase
VVPTGVRLEHFAHGDGHAFRRQMGIPEDAFVVGHLGRLAPEKNLEFLARRSPTSSASHPHAHFLVIGRGPAEAPCARSLRRAGLEARLHVAGILQTAGTGRRPARHGRVRLRVASETQGMVLTEAMAAGLPVVALDAPGAREVVRDRHNGRLLLEADARGIQRRLAVGRRAARRRLRELANRPRSTPPRPFPCRARRTRPWPATKRSSPEKPPSRRG